MITGINSQYIANNVSVHGPINKQNMVHTIFKRKRILMPAMVQINFKGNVISKISHSQKGKHYVISTIRGTFSSRNCKERVVVVRAWGWKSLKELVVNSSIFQFYG